jgi:hypothetical protein
LDSSNVNARKYQSECILFSLYFVFPAAMCLPSPRVCGRFTESNSH